MKRRHVLGLLVIAAALATAASAHLLIPGSTCATTGCCPPPSYRVPANTSQQGSGPSCGDAEANLFGDLSLQAAEVCSPGGTAGPDPCGESLVKTVQCYESGGIYYLEGYLLFRCATC